MEGRGNLEFLPSFWVPGSRRSHGRVRHIAHIPKCQFRTRAAKAPTTNNFSFVAEARTPSCSVRFQCAGWIPVGQQRGRMRRTGRPSGVGTITGRHLAAGATIPWNVRRWARGAGTNAASLAMKSLRSKTTSVAPLRHLRFKRYSRRPSGSSDKRSDDTAGRAA